MEDPIYALVVLGIVGVVLFVVYAVVYRSALRGPRHAGDKDDGILGPLATGGVSLLVQDSAPALRADKTGRGLSPGARLLDALATGGVSLVADRSSSTRGDDKSVDPDLGVPA